MSADRKTDAELWANLQNLNDDLLRPDAPVEHADLLLREAGLDPAAVGHRGAEFVAGLARKRRLSWRDRARDQIAAMTARASRTVRPDLTGAELRAAVARMRAAIGPELNAAFRAHNDDEMTDDELRELLADMESVKAINEPDDHGGKP